jgi:hypothetical protein
MVQVEVITGIHPDYLQERINSKLNEDNRYVLLQVVPDVNGQVTYTRFIAIFQAPPPPVEAEAGFVPVVEVDTPLANAVPNPVVAIREHSGGRKSCHRRGRTQRKRTTLRKR